METIHTGSARSRNGGDDQSGGYGFDSESNMTCYEVRSLMQVKGHRSWRLTGNERHCASFSGRSSRLEFR